MEGVIYRLYAWCDEHGELELFFDTLSEARDRAKTEIMRHEDDSFFYVDIFEQTERKVDWYKGNVQ